MKRSVYVLLALVMLVSIIPTSGLATAFSDMLDGPLTVVLPEDATIVPGKTFEQYLISWEPENDIYEYQFGAFREIQGKKNGSSAVLLEVVGGGWIGNGKITDGDGKAYTVAMAPFENRISPLDGEKSERNIATIVNEFCELSADKMLWNDDVEVEKVIGYYVLIVIVPQSGEPIVQIIELPFDLTAAE